MIVKSIHIEHFRCFHQTTGNDFGRVNLLGGKNNAGKTALLEALFLMNEPSNRTIQYLQRFRREDNDFIKNMPLRAWDNFFYTGSKEDGITIKATYDDKTERTVMLSCNESVEEFISTVRKTKDDEENDDILAFANSLTKKDISKSALHIKAYLNTHIQNSTVFIASGNGIVGRGLPYVFKKTHLIPASFKLSNEDLAEEFDKAKFEGGVDILLEAFRLIDESIDSVDTFTLGKSAIYLKRKGEKHYMPLTLYGDAMNKVADFILRIINNRNSLILIDEIENGIHYTNQEKLWKMIFRLVREYDIQLFATSHSAEMIKAFNDVVQENNYHEDARYFELAKHTVTNEITIQKLVMNVLENKLATNKPVRGE